MLSYLEEGSNGKYLNTQRSTDGRGKSGGCNLIGRATDV